MASSRSTQVIFENMHMNEYESTHAPARARDIPEKRERIVGKKMENRPYSKSGHIQGRYRVIHMHHAAFQQDFTL